MIMDDDLARRGEGSFGDWLRNLLDGKVSVTCTFSIITASIPCTLGTLGCTVAHRSCECDVDPTKCDVTGTCHCSCECHPAEPDRIAALTAQVATLEGEREELLAMLDSVTSPVDGLHRLTDPEPLFRESRALVRRVRGGT